MTRLRSVLRPEPREPALSERAIGWLFVLFFVVVGADFVMCAARGLGWVCR